MKLVFHGHDERYVAEQSLMNLFPGERPVYEPIVPDDDSWAVISLREDGDRCAVRWSWPTAGRTGDARMRRPSPAAILTGRASAVMPWAPAFSWRPGHHRKYAPLGDCSPASGPTSR